jgi:hypothetical protein
METQSDAAASDIQAMIQRVQTGSQVHKENMMSGKKLMVALFCAAAMFAMTSTANAQGLKFLGVGSSAMFQTFGVAAFNDLCIPQGGASNCHHYSVNGKTSGGNNFAQVVDSRANGAINPEGGNLWIVWDNSTSPATVWAYLSVDSIVGNRAFFAVPRAQLQVDTSVTTGNAKNLINSLLFDDGAGNPVADDSSLPSAILSAIQTTFTAAGSDIRVEDAKLATNRALSNLDTAKISGLGYNQSGASCTPNGTFPTLIGCPMKSTYDSTVATPVQYAIKAKDPFTNLTAWKYTQLDVAAVPEVVLYNVSDVNGLGKVDGSGNPLFKNINRFTLASTLNGSLGRAQDLDLGLAGNTTPLTVILREALSGTMNVMEYSIPRNLAMQTGVPALSSQEAGINLGNACTPTVNCPNPLFLPGPGGSHRERGIGNGQVTNGISNSTVGGVKNTANSLAYAFFSYGNVSKFTGSGGTVRYVTVDGVDPFNANYGTNTFQSVSYGPGQLPACNAPCPLANGTSYPNVRNGSYPIWNIVRLITDASGPNKANAQALITAAQGAVNSKVPDFVPFVCTTPSKCNGEPGLLVFRSHYTIAGIATKAANGNNTAAEAGGDIGGGVFPIQADKDFFSDTGKELTGYRQ